MRPQLWVVAGPNGAGKSTMADRYLIGQLPVVNPDNIARELDQSRYISKHLPLWLVDALPAEMVSTRGLAR